MSDKIAVVTSGLGNKRPDNIIRDLEKRGYTVQWYGYNNLGVLPPVEEIDLALGHSAGATRVELEYGNNTSGVRVISLDSPTRFGDDNVVDYYSNVFDPISVIGMFVNPFKSTTGNFLQVEWNPHDKNSAYSQVDWSEGDAHG